MSDESKEAMKQFTGDVDQLHAPLENEADRLPWTYFNSDFYSSDRKYEDVREICLKYSD
jgi:hypothetical protein